VKTAPLLRALAVLFWLALVVTLVMALLPRPPVAALGLNDKLQHMAAFAVLSLLAWLAFPRQRLRVLFLALAAIGGLIEILQMIPALHRDADVKDWIADCIAIAAVLGFCGSLRWIWGRGGRQSAP
jgi:hypothetical protein